ncbi:MAG: polyphosphate kinase [Deferribacteres bacterium]|nr:polyphosphate kinase [Deferribacteres bacterium]
MSLKKTRLNEFPVINRELSWLEFNERVLNLSYNKEIPLFERCKFLGIFSSNLNEFFMIRVGGLKDQIAAGYVEKDRAGFTPWDLLIKLNEKIKKLYEKESKYFEKLIDDLAKAKFYFNHIDNENVKRYVRYIFEKEIRIVLSPVVLTKNARFPFITSGKIFLMVELIKNSEVCYGVVIVPDKVEKIFTFSFSDKKYFFTNCFIIERYLNELFPGYEITGTAKVKITRNADLEIDEEGAEDLLRLIEESLDKRRKGAVTRIEAMAADYEKWTKVLKNYLDFEDIDIFEKKSIIDSTVLFHLQSEKKEHYYKPFRQYLPAYDEKSIFERLRKKPLLMYRPYNDFDFIANFVMQAAQSKETLAIKITIYRVNFDSKIVDALIFAAKKGVSVSAIVELKARFDEENNVELAKKLEDAGCIVIYGYPRYKVHAKLLLVVRREEKGIKGYAHISTGNYNEKTSKIYTDVDYLTSEDDIVDDVKDIFNFMMGYSEFSAKKRVFLAPYEIKNKIIKLIENEIENAKAGNKAHIIIKVNSLIDRMLIDKIYEASIAGVKVELIVRGICGIYPGVKGLSENIKVISIVGRFLEHPRIFYFFAGGKEDIYISSADFMERNMDRRIEAMTKITDEKCKQKLKNILKNNLNDTINGYILQKDKYKKIKSSRKFDSQDFYIKNIF